MEDAAHLTFDLSQGHGWAGFTRNSARRKASPAVGTRTFNAPARPNSEVTRQGVGVEASAPFKTL